MESMQKGFSAARAGREGCGQIANASMPFLQKPAESFWIGGNKAQGLGPVWSVMFWESRVLVPITPAPGPALCCQGLLPVAGWLGAPLVLSVLGQTGRRVGGMAANGCTHSGRSQGHCWALVSVTSCCPHASSLSRLCHSDLPDRPAA